MFKWQSKVGENVIPSNPSTPEVNKQQVKEGAKNEGRYYSGQPRNDLRQENQGSFKPQWYNDGKQRQNGQKGRGQYGRSPYWRSYPPK